MYILDIYHMLPFKVLAIRETEARHSLIRLVGRPPVVYSWRRVYIYIYICVCVCVCVCAFVRVRVYVSTYLCIYLCMSVYIYIYLCMSVYVCLCLCLYMSVHVFVYRVSVHVFVYRVSVCVSKHGSIRPMRRIVMSPSFICFCLVIIKSPHVRLGHHP
jgi:nuclear pore complex protein Nup62